jgi:hypothetical protein
MGEVVMSARFWVCDRCGFQWRANEKRPRQCRRCGSRKWDGGAVAEAKTVRFVKPLSYASGIAKLLSART